MSIAAAHLWHKPSERAAWMRRFVIVSDSAIRIYGTRNDHEQHNSAMYYIELLTTTDLINGSDNIVYQGWLEKKGKIKWNARWCALVKYGYLNYIDPEQKQGIRSIDISEDCVADLSKTQKNNGIQWRNPSTNEWFQFRCDSPSIQSRWFTEMEYIRQNCDKFRLHSAVDSKEPTLFAFIVRKSNTNTEGGITDINDIKSNRFCEHFFCADNEQFLEGWKKCIIEQIAHSNDGQTNKQSLFVRNKLSENRKRSYNNGTNTDTLREYQNKPRFHNKSSVSVNTNDLSSASKYLHRSSQISVDWIDYAHISDAEIDDRLTQLMNVLRIPKHARSNMFALHKKQKISLLEQQQIRENLKAKKQKQNHGRVWSQKFANYNNGTETEQSRNKTIQTLQQFSVVLRDENSDAFLRDFISDLGLSNLCHLATAMSHCSSSSFDTELLRVLKAIIDSNEYALQCLVNDKLCIRIIVEKIDCADVRVSELSLSLLITMVGIENDEIAICAANKILHSLHDLAVSKGQRNKYKVLVSHMSVKDILNASFTYDTYTLSLLNYLIMCVPDLHMRMDERRLLNSLQFEQILDKLEDRVHKAAKDSVHTSLNDALRNQIDTYRKLYETDKRNANHNDWDMIDIDFDIDNPKDLFAKVCEQCLNDGYINELTAILKNLMVLPSNAEHVWYNLSKIVRDACKPTQQKMLSQTPSRESREEKESVVNDRIETRNFDENYVIKPESVYPTYTELRTLLEVRNVTPNSHSMNALRDNKYEKLQNELGEARDKHLALEEALLSEKSKNLSLDSQLQHLLKYGTGNGNAHTPLTKANSNSSNVTIVDSDSSFIVVNETDTNANESEADKKQEIMPQIKNESVSKPQKTTVSKAMDSNSKLDKYRKMIKYKMPKNSIINRMRQDGIDRSVIEGYAQSNALPNATKNKNTVSNGMRDPKAAMLAMIAGKTGQNIQKNKPKNICESDEKQLNKYRRMLKISIPKQSVINRMRQDECAPRVIALLFPNAIEGKSDQTNAEKNGKAMHKSHLLSAIPKKKKPALPPGLKRKKVIKPKNKMRNLHWTTVNPFEITHTIWNGIYDETIEFDIADLESKFCWKQMSETQKSKSETLTVAQKGKSDIVRVLDTRRAYNIEIFLGRLKMDPWALRTAMLSLDESRLSLDTTHKLINFVPTKEESRALDGYENEQNLAVAERFVKIIRTVDSDLIERLQLWEFKMEFEDLYRSETQKLVWLRKGHDCIRKSPNLQTIFCIILSFGNYMNGSTNKGCAYGFKLASLSQLMRSRTVDNSATLMEYLYEFVLLNANEKYRNALHFAQDLQCLPEACSVDISILRQNIAQIGTKLKRIRARIDSFNDQQMIARMGDNFLKIMKPFYVCAIKKYENVQKIRDAMFVDLKSLGLWLNEAKDSNFKYLKTLNEFRLNFLKTGKLYTLKKEKELQMQKRKKWKENKVSKNNRHKNEKNKLLNSKATIAVTTQKKTESLDTNNIGNNNRNETEMEMDTNNNESKDEKESIELGNETKNTNISDVIINALVAGTSHNFIQRLQNINKSASKNKYSSPQTMSKKTDLI